MYLSRTQCVAVAVAVGLIAALLAAAPAGAQSDRPAVSVAAMAEYHRVLAEYNRVHDAYLALASAYWSSIGDKRKLRFGKRARNEALAIDDYVLTQPPVYSGPPQPVDPSAPPEEAKARRTVPVVADFLNAAKQEYKFAPRQPQSDIEFKRAYAPVAAAAGLTKDQAVRVYGFEATGIGGYDIQAGLEYNKPGAHAITTALEYNKPGAHAITTALGYNQLLTTNSVELMAESGDKFIASLEAKAKGLPEGEKPALQNTIAVVRKMVAFARTVPDDWGQHEVLGGTPKGLAIHAMNLDLDVGPLLQTQKLMDSVVFAKRKGYAAPLTAAELEMMNLTGDGNGFDMVQMPADWRTKVPTTNFFQRRGYAENPVAQRNNTVAALIAATDAAMDRETKKQGAKDLAGAFPK